MYAGLFRILPGPIWLRIILFLGILALAVWALFTYAFPWVDQIVNPIEVTVTE